MKKLVLLLSLMFVGVAGQFSTVDAAAAGCTDCWEIAHATEALILNGRQNHDVFTAIFELCRDNADKPC